MDYYLMISVALLLAVHFQQEKRIQKAKRAISSQQRAIEQLRHYIAQENEAKLELHRMFARFPVAACAIYKIQRLEKQVTSLRRLWQSRHENVCERN